MLSYRDLPIDESSESTDIGLENNEIVWTIGDTVRDAPIRKSPSLECAPQFTGTNLGSDTVTMSTTGIGPDTLATQTLENAAMGANSDMRGSESTVANTDMGANVTDMSASSHWGVFARGNYNPYGLHVLLQPEFLHRYVRPWNMARARQWQWKSNEDAWPGWRTFHAFSPRIRKVHEFVGLQRADRTWCPVSSGATLDDVLSLIDEEYMEYSNWVLNKLSPDNPQMEEFHFLGLDLDASDPPSKTLQPPKYKVLIGAPPEQAP